MRVNLGRLVGSGIALLATAAGLAAADVRLIEAVRSKNAAATPKRAARPMIFRLLRCSWGTNGVMSNSGTSAATLTG